MQAWWAAGSMMLTQGSSACACAGGRQRGASAITAADAPISALFITSSSPDPPNGRRVVATADTVSLPRDHPAKTIHRDHPRADHPADTLRGRPSPVPTSRAGTTLRVTMVSATMASVTVTNPQQTTPPSSKHSLSRQQTRDMGSKVYSNPQTPDGQSPFIPPQHPKICGNPQISP
jgi:hypothetical protein